MPIPKSVCIIYGVNEGPAMARKFIAACEAAGFVMTTNRHTADVIVAHSGGALLVPEKSHTTRILLIGIAYWPGKHWLAATVEHLKDEASLNHSAREHWQSTKKWAWRAVYFWKLRTMLRMYHNQNMKAPWNSIERQIIVRNQRDAYCCPDIHTKTFRGPRTFISLPGAHDDCWINPERYISLLQSEL